MRHHTRRTLWIALPLLAIGGCTFLFLTLFERYSEERDLGWGDAARRNPYLAAQQFLTAAGHSTRGADNISVLAQLAAEDTLLLTSSSHIYNGQRLQDFLAWIERGGHAIVIARIPHVFAGTGEDDSESERDWLLEHFGVTVEEGSGDFYFDNPLRDLLGDQADELSDDYSGKSASEILREHNRKLQEKQSAGEGDKVTDTDSGGDTPPVEEQKPEERKTPRNPEVELDRLVLLTAEDGSDFQLYFDSSHLLWHPALQAETDSPQTNSQGLEPVFWAGIDAEEAGVPFLQFEHGEGLLTLMADAELWQSRRIGQFDHAYLLDFLASDGDFVFLTRPQFASLTDLAKRYMRELFIAGGLALLAWLLLRSRRFGPSAPEPEAARRSLLEHISASGHYYWRADRGAQLAENLRAQLLRRLRAEQMDSVQRQQLCRRLAAQTHINEEQIAAILWAPVSAGSASEEAFTARIRSMQQIEAAL